jgi:hypothetical protein
MVTIQRFIVADIKLQVTFRYANFDVRKIVPPKWYFIFIPWKWAHFFIYKKRTLRPVFTMEKPVKL